MSKTPDDVVGYGKPPKAYQFKPGQSGNPAGKAKGLPSKPPSLIDEILSALHEKVVITVGGKKKKITKQTLFAKMLVNKAVEVNPNALKCLKAITNNFDPLYFGANTTSFRMTEEAEALIDQVKDEILALSPEEVKKKIFEETKKQ